MASTQTSSPVRALCRTVARWVDAWPLSCARVPGQSPVLESPRRLTDGKYRVRSPHRWATCWSERAARDSNPNRQIRSHRPPVPSRPPRPFASPSAQLSGHAYGLSRASVPACPAPHGRNLVAVSGHHCQTRCLAACLVKHLRNAPSTRFKVWCPSFRSKDTDRAWSARGAQTLATADRAASWGRDSATRRWGSGQLPLTSPGASTSPRQPGELLALRVGLHQPWL